MTQVADIGAAAEVLARDPAPHRRVEQADARHDCANCGTHPAGAYRHNCAQKGPVLTSLVFGLFLFTVAAVGAA